MSNIASRTPRRAPCLALGAIVWAGVEGIRCKLSLRPPDKDFWAISEEQRLAKGFLRLPRTLGLALQNLAESPAVRNWFGATFLDVYLRFKQAELRVVEGLGEIIFLLMSVFVVSAQKRLASALKLPLGRDIKSPGDDSPRPHRGRL